MKKFYLLLMATIFLFACDKDDGDDKNNKVKAPPAHEWQEITSFPGEKRMHATAFSLNGYGYLGLGIQNYVDTYKNFYKYDPTSDTWQQLNDFPGSERYAAVSFVIGGHAYVGLGYSNNKELDDMWKYDPSTDSWTQLSDFPGYEGGYNHFFTLNSKGYVFFPDKNSTWEYDPSTDSWTQKSDFPVDDYNDCATFTLGGKGYLATGLTDDLHKHVYVYDPATDEWTQLTDFAGEARCDAVGFSIGGYGFVGTGLIHGTYFYTPKDDLWCYDHINNRWFSMENIPFSGSLLQSFVIGDIAYVGGGITGFGMHSDYNRRYFKFYQK